MPASCMMIRPMIVWPLLFFAVLMITSCRGEKEELQGLNPQSQIPAECIAVASNSEPPSLPPGINRIRGVKYATVADPFSDGMMDLLLDVYLPDNTETDRPLIIFFSGGGFAIQDRDFVASTALAMAERGFVTATVDYRVLCPNDGTMSKLRFAIIRANHDLFAAVRFMRAMAQQGNPYGTVSDTIFVGGESAGGALALNASLLDEEQIDLLTEVEQDYLAEHGGIHGNIGDFLDVDPSFHGVFSISGFTIYSDLLDASDLPIILAHAEGDALVSCNTLNFEGADIVGSCDLIEQYENIGIENELILIENSDAHEFFSDDELDLIHDRAADFLQNL